MIDYSRNQMVVSMLFCTLKVVDRACHGAYFVAHVSKYLVPNVVSGRPA